MKPTTLARTSIEIASSIQKDIPCKEDVSLFPKIGELAVHID